MSFSGESKPDSKLCIIKAAASLFAKLGLDKCSTREIAKQSDSNISLISYYFGGKEGLYKEVMRSYALEVKENAQKIIQSMDGVDLTRQGFIDHMDRVIENMINSNLNNPEMSQIFSREKLAGMPYSKDIHEEIFYPLVQNFFRLVIQGQKNGFIKEDINPAVLFITLSEGIWGFYEIMACKTTLRENCEPLLEDRNELKKQILNIYVMGVLK
jgi:AcrR family transcriptional regulator